MQKALTITKKTHLTVELITIIPHLNYGKLQLKYVGFPANFESIEVIPSGEYRRYRTYYNTTVGVMGPWNVHGQVYLVHSGGQIDIGSSSPYPYGLIYGCLFQTGDRDYFNNYDDVLTTYIERTFNNVVPGTSFHVSFWITLRSDFSNTPPSTFKVYLNSEMVYSGPPTSHVWELMNTTTFITNVPYLTLRFEITSMDTGNRNMGINGIIIHPSATAQGPTSWSQGSIQPSAQPSSQPSTYLISQNSEGKFLTTI
jgi:hypothetical protein